MKQYVCVELRSERFQRQLKFLTWVLPPTQMKILEENIKGWDIKTTSYAFNQMSAAQLSDVLQNLQTENVGLQLRGDKYYRQEGWEPTYGLIHQKIRASIFGTKLAFFCSFFFGSSSSPLFGPGGWELVTYQIK